MSKQYRVEITYQGIIEETIEAESQDEADFIAQDISVMDVPSEAEVDTISVFDV